VLKYTDEDKRELEGDLDALLLSLTAPGMNSILENNIFEQVFGQATDAWRAEYKNFQETTGDYETSFIDFMNNIRQNTRAIAKDGNIIMTPDQVTQAEVYWAKILEHYGEGRAELIGMYDDGV